MIKVKRTIQFYDCDPAGILFYGRLFSFCHSAYEELISSFPLQFNYWANDEFLVPIIKTNAEYFKPFFPNDEMIISVTVSRLKSSSFELSYNCNNQNGELCATVKTVHVFIDKKNWEKIKIPVDIEKGLRKHFEST